jgi:hypothetical protein
MDLMQTIFTAVITSGIVTAMLNWYIKSRELGEQRRWEIKREACLEALETIDARFADYDWNTSNGNPMKVDKQDFVETAKIRSCFNRLVLACNDSKVPQLFEKCLHLQFSESELPPLDMKSVVSLRNAIRKELGFGKDLTTDVSWITFITWRNPNRK